MTRGVLRAARSVFGDDPSTKNRTTVAAASTPVVMPMATVIYRFKTRARSLYDFENALQRQIANTPLLAAVERGQAFNNRLDYTYRVAPDIEPIPVLLSASPTSGSIEVKHEAFHFKQER